MTCKVLLCVGVGLIKKTLAWQQIPCIPCSGKIEKYLRIKPFSAVAICDLVCCNQSSFSGLVTIFPITLRHKELLVIICIPAVASFSSSIGIFFTFCYLELDSIAGFTATFTRMIIPMSSTCVQNMVIVTACKHLAEKHVFLPKIELFSAVAVCCLVCCRLMFLPKLSRHVLCNSEVY